MQHETKVFLIFGGQNGWIGQMMMKLVEERKHRAVAAQSRLEDRNALKNELESVKPDYVLNCAGITGRPNVDWCEDHKQETIRSNVIGTLTLTDVCWEKKLHLTHFATGCIFAYDEQHPIGSGIGFTEQDIPNFHDSFYSHTKASVEDLLRHYDNTLILRIRMPISDDLHPRNFITKIINYQKVVNIPNSMTILHDLLPLALQLTLNQSKGIVNFTNPGTISHNEILDLYKHYIDPNFTYQNFSLEEQSLILKAGRSNNELDTSHFQQLLPSHIIPPIKESIHHVFQRMKSHQQ